MPDNNTEAENKLRKLGQRVREGFAKENPIQERSIETTRTAIREEWEKSRAAKGPQTSEPILAKDRTRKPDASEPER